MKYGTKPKIGIKWSSWTNNRKRRNTTKK